MLHVLLAETCETINRMAESGETHTTHIHTWVGLEPSARIMMASSVMLTMPAAGQGDALFAAREWVCDALHALAVQVERAA